ncbi:hypothetical protein ACQJBY_029560 [Aegilops geniculata]
MRNVLHAVLIISYRSKILAGSSGNMATARILPLSAAQLHQPAGGDQDQNKMVVYTVWMKSLVFNGHGCTIYGEDGRVAYRVDNYACNRSREVFVMNTAGKSLIKLRLKKIFGFFETWQGYLCRNDDDEDDDTSSFQQEPWFSVRKEHRNLNKDGRRHGSRAIVWVPADGKAYAVDGASQGSEYYRHRRRERRGRGGGQEEADSVRGGTGRGRPDADDGPRRGSPARPWARGRVWPAQPLHLIG